MSSGNFGHKYIPGTGFKKGNKLWKKYGFKKGNKPFKPFRKGNEFHKIYGFKKGNKMNKIREREEHPRWTGGNNTRSRRKYAPRPCPQKCEICGVNGKEFRKGLCYDHDHKTGKFRGWICLRCNFALGYAKENIDILKLLIKYLENNMAK
jgi:hypothetical protein